MGKIQIRNGTPIGTSSRCSSCMHAHVIEGYRETEVVVYCTYMFDTPVLVPFKVRECSNYSDKNRPTWEQMEKLALPIRETSSLKPAGFRLKSGERLGEEAEVASSVVNE